jgi:hypothetical protein
MARTYDGRLQVFGTNAAHVTFRRTQLGAGGLWTAWSRLDGTFGALAAETNADGRTEVFGVAPDGTVSHTWQVAAGGAWTRWTRIEGYLHP